jgi:hypothetical protein
MRSPRVRRLIVLAVGALACGVAVWRIAPMGPSLQFRVWRQSHNAEFDVYAVQVFVRGGEAIDEVVIEPAQGRVFILEGASMRDAAPGQTLVFQARLDGDGAGGVRVRQRGRVAREYDVALRRGT